MTDARTAAIEVAALKALADEVSAQYKAAKQRALDALDAGDRKGAVLPDGQDIGTVWVTKGKVSGAVTDPAALLEWAKAYHPDEVETVHRVRDSFVAALLGRSENVDGTAVDTRTGEVIPGLTYRLTEPYVAAKQTPEQRQAFVRAWVDGHLRLRLGALLGAPVSEVEAPERETS